MIVRGEGAYVWDQHGKRYLDGLAGLFTSQLGHGRTELAEAGAKQAGTLAYFPLWTYAHPRAIELAERVASYAPGRPQPRLLHHRRLRGGGVGLEAGPPVLPHHGPAAADEGHQPLHRLPRHLHGRAVHHRHPRAARRRSSRWCPARSRCPTPTSTGPSSSPTTRWRSGGGPPTRSSGPSSARAPTPSPRSSSSRCRTPAAASRRRPATSSGCARSATATACCSSPTRSSAPSAASATGSAPCATTTSPTSSRWPRA